MLRASRVGALITLGLHAGVVGALLSYAPARSALLSAAPIMVDWIAAPKVELAPEPPAPRKPKPVHRKPQPVETPKIITAPVETPSPIVAPAPPPPEPVAVVPTPEPVLVAPPIFSADYLKNPAPVYPPLSRRLGEQGRVILRVLVNSKGSAEEVQLRASSGSARLDESALETVSRWKFVPAKQGTEPVPAWVLIPISFKLDS